MREYGVSMEWYDEQFRRQSGKCAICGKPPGKDGVFRVDHDHKTGEVRGLLCLHCNMRLGFLEDEEWLINAKRYLDWEIARLEAETGA